MIVVLLIWILLAPLGAWIIGASIRLSEQRRPVVADDAAEDGPCSQDEEVGQLVAAAG